MDTVMTHDKFCPLPLLGGLPDDTDCFVCEALRLKAADEREKAAQRVMDVGGFSGLVRPDVYDATARGGEKNA